MTALSRNSIPAVKPAYANWWQGRDKLLNMGVSKIAMGKRLQAARKLEKLTGEEVATYLNSHIPDAAFTRQNVSHWETGKHYPDYDVLNLLALRYRVSLNVLITGEEAEQTLMRKSEYEMVIRISEAPPHLREWMLLAGDIVMRAKGNLPTSLLSHPTEENWLEFAKALWEAAHK
jgi:transcriptional regulator with XRE-family HTH domain